jgi:hypothetical protein
MICKLALVHLSVKSQGLFEGGWRKAHSENLNRDTMFKKWAGFEGHRHVNLMDE